MKPNHRYHIRGYYKSEKVGEIYFASSYELRCFYLLDQDEKVKSYQRCEKIKVNGRNRTPDLLVHSVNGDKTIVEIKPITMEKFDEVRQQIKDNISYATSMGYNFKLWTETDCQLTEQGIVKWAREYLAKHGDGKSLERKRLLDNAKAKKYREKHYYDLRMTVWCEYCKCDHTVLKHEHKNNVKKNSRFICIKENGHIIGKLPKKKKVNPYVDQDMKQCTVCKQIKLHSDFNLDKSRRDGYSSKCKNCNSAECSNRYRKKTGK